MTRRIPGSLVAMVASAILGTASTPAAAQHYHGSGGHHSGGHYDYHPGHYDYHNGHYDYHPGHYDWHSTPHHVQPQPTYISPPRTTYYGATTGHSHDHIGTSHTTRRITYGGFSHIDNLAIALENQANSLCLELYYNYQHNPGYVQTYREAYEILTTAKYIHGLEHAGNRDKIRQAVAELDNLFHHVERDVARWTAHHHRHVGHGGLTAKLEDVEETLHHLMDDIGARSTARSEYEQAPPAVDHAPPAVETIGFPR